MESLIYSFNQPNKYLIETPTGNNQQGLEYLAYNKLGEMWSKNVLYLGNATFDMMIPSCYADEFIPIDEYYYSLPFVCVVNPRSRVTYGCSDNNSRCSVALC